MRKSVGAEVISLIVFCLSLFLGITNSKGKEIEGSDSVSYHKQIKPILQRECYGCHQPAKDKGGFVMTEFSKLLKGGESDEKAIVIGQPAKSLLISLITPVDGEAEMPPEKSPLSTVEIELIAKWISQGAHDDSPANSKIKFSQANPPVYYGAPTVTSLAFSPDGLQLAVSGYHEVLLFEVASGELKNRLIGESQRIQSLEWAPDGKRLAVAGGSPGRAGEIQIWNIELNKLELSHFSTYDTLSGLSWSPDGSKVAYGATDNVVRAISIKTGEQVLYQGSHDDWVLDTTFTTDGEYVISVGRDMTAKLTHLSTQRFIDNITSITPGALKGGINSITSYPKGDFILFGGADGAPKIYRYIRKTNRQIGDDANQIMVLPSQTGRIFDVTFNKSGNRVASVSSLHGNGYLQIASLPDDLNPPENIRKILVKPTHQRNGGEKSTLNSYFAEKAKVIVSKTYEKTPLYAVDYSPTSDVVAVAGKNGEMNLIDAGDGSLIRKIQVAPSISPVVQSEKKDSKNSSSSNAWILPHQRPLELPLQTIPKGIQFSSIEVQPNNISINEPHSYAQLVVSGMTENGSIWDLSRLVRYEYDSNLIQVNRTGFVQPIADGSSAITIKMGDFSKEIPVNVQGVSSPYSPNWALHVNPVLSRLGCNAGTCHGSKDGKNGFKLSLRGYDPVMDITSLTDDIASRRVNFASPTRSLMLLKSSSEIPHEGGQLVNPDHDYYKVLEKWILDGGQVKKSSATKVVSLKIYPLNPVVERKDFFQQMKVTAVYSDGNERDVTREAFLESGNTEVGEAVDGWPGLVKALRRGEAPILVRYEGAYASTILTVMGDRTGFVWKEPAFNNAIDKYVAQKWKRMKIRPSGLADDYTFVRRLYLDLTGLPPTQEQFQSFVDSQLPSDEKRNILIDELLHSEAYIDHWANKWADLLQVNSKFLGAEGAQIFRNWIHNEVANNTPYNQFVSKIITAEGSNRENPPASYFKILRDPELTMENTTHLFLATRFNCNKCHDHPFERWTQDQYYEMAAFFARTSLKTDPESKNKKIGGTAVESAKPLFEIVFENDKGEITHQRTGLQTPPEFPFPAGPTGNKVDNRREVLADWMTSSDNPYFASSYVNRLWGYLLGTGIIEPLDDIRAGNPPSNPQLLEYLENEFINSNFDTRHIIRLITQSRTYQLSIDSNKWNEDDQINFSHAKARRLPAEVLYDSIHAVLNSTPKIPGVTPGTRAAELPDSGIKLKDGFLGNFGRPARESSCECERSSDLQLGPVMALISGPTLGKAISDKENILSQLISQADEDNEWINNIFERILNRPATRSEIQSTIDVLQAQPNEHQRLVKLLSDYKDSIQEQRDKLEAQRLENIAQAESTLKEFESYWKNEKDRLTKERAEKAQVIEDQINARSKSINENLASHTESLRDLTRWNPSALSGFSASNGIELRHVGANKFLASGNDTKSTYSLFIEPELSLISGIRLDTIPHPSLPKQGPGRAKNDGNFVLTELEAEYLSPNSKSLNQPLVDVWDLREGPESKWKLGANTNWKQSGSGFYAVESKGNDPIISTTVSAPAGWHKLEILMEADPEKILATELFYNESDGTSYEAGKSHPVLVDAAAGPVQNITFLWETKADLKGIRFDPRTDVGLTSIYQISLTSYGPMTSQKLKFSKAKADFSQNNFDISKAINGNLGDGDGWAVSPQLGKPHTGLFGLEKPLEIQSNRSGILKLNLVQNYKGNQWSIGHFQIKLTGSKDPLQFGLPDEIGIIASMTPESRSKIQTDKLVSFILEKDKATNDLKKELAELRKPVPDDPKLAQLSNALKEAQLPVPPDPVLERLKHDVNLSQQQLENPKLTVAQDLAWALINSPAFLFNH